MRVLNKVTPVMKFSTVAIGSFAVLALGSTARAQAPSYNWSGVYGGISVGGSFGDRHQAWSPVGSCTNQSVCFAPGSRGLVPYATTGSGPVIPSFASNENGPLPVGWPGSLNDAGFTPSIGFSLGYNRQIAPNIVIGVENQLNVFAIQSGNQYANSQAYGPYNDGYVGTASGQRTDEVNTTSGPRWLDTFTGRLGFAHDRTLFYVKGGLAVGGVRLATDAHSLETNTYYNNGYAGDGTSSTATSWNGSTSATRAGLAVGGGIEQSLTDAISLKVDATYYNLGRVSTTATGTSLTTTTGTLNSAYTPPPGTGTAQAYKVSQKFDGVLLSVGLNFHY